MSGIVGFVGPGFATDAIDGMLDAISHRGPDGLSYKSSGPAFFGHALLAASETSDRWSEPVLLDNGTLLVADARVDNRDEVLVRLGLDRASASDAELLATAWQQWGDEIVHEIVGPFALAVWDPRNAEVTCIRDHLGVRPLFFWHDKGAFAFGSEASSILALDRVGRRLDPQFVADQLANIWGDWATTGFVGVHRVPPASIVTYSSGTGTVHQTRYWHPDELPPLSLGSDDEYERQFRELLDEAVLARLHGADNPAVHVSGGIDSSTVYCAARDVAARHRLPAPTPASLIFETVQDVDERGFIGPVVAGAHRHLQFPGDDTGPIGDMPSIFADWDTPVFGPSHQYILRLTERLAAEGCDVILDGFDGDSIFSHGYERLSELAARGDWDTFETEAAALEANGLGTLDGHLQLRALPLTDYYIRSARALAAIQTISATAKRSAGPRTTLRALTARALRVTGSELRRRLRPRATDRKPGTPRIPPLPTAAAIERFGLRERAARFSWEEPAPRSALVAHAVRATSPAITFALESADYYAARCGVDSRHPLLDKRLVEFCVRVPPDQKLRDGWPRSLVRRAMAGALPESVRLRVHKTMAGPNFRHGLLVHDRALLESTLAACDRLLPNLVRLDTIAELRRRIADTNWADVDVLEPRYLFRIASIGIWLESQLRKGASWEPGATAP